MPREGQVSCALHERAGDTPCDPGRGTASESRYGKCEFAEGEPGEFPCSPPHFTHPNMKISEIMTTDVEVVSPEATIKDAAQRMVRLDVGALPVWDGERLVGMVTDRDLVVRAVAEGRDPETTTVGDCMSPKIVYCFEDQSLDEARHTMEEKKIRRLPVLNRDKHLVGILAIGDLAVKTDEDQEVGHTLQEISRPAA